MDQFDAVLDAIPDDPEPVDVDSEPVEPEPDTETDDVEASETPDLEDGSEVGDDDPEAEEDGGGPAIGSKEKPYTVKNLPRDTWVKLKVDGEEQVVNLREAADGVIRQETFNRRANELHEHAQKLKERASSLKEREGRLRSSLSQLMSEPEGLARFLDKYAEREVIVKMTEMFARRELKFRELPPEKQAAILRKRDVELLRAREERTRKEREERARQEELTARAQEAQKRFEPAYQEGLRKAGYPKVDGTMRKYVRGILWSERQEKGSLSPEDVTAAVVKAAKLAKPDKQAGKKPPAPKKRAEPRRRGGKKRKKYTDIDEILNDI